jgi:hypothetical protein
LRKLPSKPVAWWPESVLATAKPRINAERSPAYPPPSGGCTLPFKPPPPWKRKRPFQFVGSATAKPMPYGLPSRPLRSSITPSTRQCAGTAGATPGALAGISCAFWMTTRCSVMVNCVRAAQFGAALATGAPNTTSMAANKRI